MMDSSHLDQAEKSSPETFSDTSLPPDSPDTNDIFGDPEVHPRVGDEYQVEIPSIVSKSELIERLMNPADPQGIVDSSHYFFMGLPMPVMWVRSEEHPIKTERLEYVDHPHGVYTNGLVEPERLTTSQISSDRKEPNVKFDAPNQTTLSNANWLVPDKPTESWSDFEADCFLLGLYLLGKNLLQVERFVGSKGLGQILAYYYGQFYASPGYSRWSESRKMRSRKCAVGHRFFTGYRQQELFSRLFPRISEESKTKVVEASRAFAEGRSSLDEYVFTLKALVGIHDLVDAVGIGKGKEDLTTIVFEGPKNNQFFSHRPEVPSGKAWSSLTCPEIVKYLTGDFRLSKARSNDLFWEAVWPRLLERGWNSEQPRGECYKGSKHLVFLIPGIKKFSRRKLSKGDQYFDSVSDVLAKVASEPELLKLVTDEATPSCSKGENGWTPEVKTDDDQDSSDHERHCYLKPRVSLGLSERTKFTVVDTSLANEDNPYKVRELRSLPGEAERSFALSSKMRKTETEAQVNAEVLPNGHQNSSLSAHPRGSSTDTVGSPSIPNGNFNLPPRPADACLPVNHKSRTIKHQFSRRVKPELSSSVGPVAKRRRISSCADTEVTFVLSLPAKNRNATLRILGPKLSQADVQETSENAVVPDVKTVQDSFSGNDVGFDMIPENEKMAKAQNVIDLNLPQVPIELESDGKVKFEEVSSSIQNSDVDKTKKVDTVEQKHCDVEKQRPFDSEKPTSSDTEDPKPFVTEKQKNPESTCVLHHDSEPKVNSASGGPLRIVLKSNQELGRHFVAEVQKSSVDTVGPSDNIEPRVSSASRDPVSVVVESDQKPGRHYVAEKQKNPGDTVGPSGNMEPQASSASGEPSKKAIKSDLQPRRLSTRSRPLTTKALEALEIGLLTPVRTYKKRSPSVAQDQKPKRSRQSRNKSPMFSDDMVFEVRAAEESSNGKTVMGGQTPTGSIPNDKENMTRGLLKISEVSLPPA